MDRNTVREDLRPLAAQAYFQLGDFKRTLELLRDYEPEQFNTRGFDPRWGLLGRIRILRGLALDSLGRRDEARAQYRLALAQWTRPDPAIQIYLDMAKRELGEDVRGARD
jgi:tetratricopeptide (TPR) repeat protein